MVADRRSGLPCSVKGAREHRSYPIQGNIECKQSLVETRAKLLKTSNRMKNMKDENENLEWWITRLVGR